MVYQLIYISSATSELDDFALREIAHSASMTNQENGITGLLLFHEGAIMQILEGDKESVETLYAKINRDTRHSGCIVLCETDSESRAFPNWFMGYKNASKDKAADALFALNRVSLEAILPTAPSPELSTLTNTYAKVIGL